MLRFVAETLVATVFCLAGLALALIVTPMGQHSHGGTLHFTFIVYLPSGCRIILAWAYGNRSAAMAAPAALIEVWSVHLLGHLPLSLWSAAVLASVPALTFAFAALLGAELRLGRTERSNWRHLVVIGGASALVETILLSALLGWHADAAALWFTGNLLGVGCTLVLLMLGFRLWRISTQRQ